MALWPFCPTVEFTEALTWRSDVLQAYGAEQRIRLTDAPRQTFGYSHAMTHRQYERAQLLMRAGGASSWDLPVWAERQRVSVAAGAGSIAVDTTASDYRAGGKALLWASDEDCELVTVDTVADSLLTLDGVTVGAYSNAFVCPVRTAYCHGGLDATRRPGPVVELQTEWMVYDGADLADAGLYGSYRSHPVVTDCARVGGGSIDEGLSVPTLVVDNGLSPPRVTAARSLADRALGMGWMPTTLAELWELRCWLHSIRGRQKGFWLPTYTNGITLAASIAPADTTITIRAIGLDGTAETGDLMIATTAGTRTYLRYTSVATVGANEVLTLSAAAGIMLAPAGVERICPLRFVRLAQDRVELAHRYRGDDRQITTVMVRAEEVPVP